MTWDKLTDFWETNIRNNYKKISSLIGDVLISIIALICFAIQQQYDWLTAFILILLTMRSFFYILLNIVFKGEAELKDSENVMLQQKLVYEQELSEYRIQLAAKTGQVPKTVIAVKDWNDINKRLELLEEQRG